MDKLEQYLDQVCRSIGGPRAMRQHVRQELREHLLDAAARHRADGLTEEDALAKALAEFGTPEEVRSDLEATHGHRVMAVVIDKAMQWKETTMKAKWLWMSWAYVGLAVVIALEGLFLTCAVIFIVPKFKHLLREGLIDPGIIDDAGASWMPAFLDGLSGFGESYATWVVLLVVAAWALFEWLVRSENKSLMRFSALGTAAVGLMVAVWLTGAALLISFCVGLPAAAQIARQFAVDQVSHGETAVSALEQAAAKKDWDAAQAHADRAAEALADLAKAAAAIPALVTRNKAPTADELRAQVKTARDGLAAAQQAIREKDAARLETALQAFRKSYGPVREAAQQRRG
jgi:hypothetical protein